MKTLITAFLISVFALSHGLCVDMLTRFVTVKVSADHHAWYGVPVDLSTAVYNPATGQREIHLTVELPQYESLQFYQAPGVVAFYGGIASPDCIGCIIIAVLILVVGGVIIYILYKTCQRLLPPAKTDNQ